jgi:hypothetical protein
VKNCGAHRPNLLEHRVLHKMPAIQWKRPQIDLSELARLRWIENWPRERLARHFSKSENAIQCYFQELKRGAIHGVGLTVKEKGRITAAWEAS